MSKTKSILFLGVLLSLPHLAVADQLDDIKARGTLVCGVLSSFEPFGFIDTVKRIPEGYDVDFCEALAKRMGVTAKIQPLSIEARIPELQQGTVDILVAGLGYSKPRATQIDYSNEYYVSDHKLTVKVSRGFLKPMDLTGQRISFTKGGVTESFLKKSVPGADLTGFESTPSAFTALVQNKVAGFSVSEVVANRLLSKLGPQAKQYTLLEPPVGTEVWGVGIKKGEKPLLDVINNSLDDIEKSGDAKQIFDKWLGENTIYKMKRSFKIAPKSMD